MTTYVKTHFQFAVGENFSTENQGKCDPCSQALKNAPDPMPHPHFEVEEPELCEGYIRSDGMVWAQQGGSMGGGWGWVLWEDFEGWNRAGGWVMPDGRTEYFYSLDDWASAMMPDECYGSPEADSYSQSVLDWAARKELSFKEGCEAWNQNKQ